MNGLLFKEFLNFVELSTCYETVDTIILKSNLPTDGAYTTIGTYPPEELFRLITSLSEEIVKPEKKIIQDYGEHMFGVYLTKYSHCFSRYASTFHFLCGIDSIIESSLRSFYHDSTSLHYQCTVILANATIITYMASPHFADFSEGILRQLINHYHENISIMREDTVDRRIKTSTFRLIEGLSP